MVPDFSNFSTYVPLGFMGLWVVFYADSDAINHFEKSPHLEVLIPSLRLRTILWISQHRLCIGG